MASHTEHRGHFPDTGTGLAGLDFSVKRGIGVRLADTVPADICDLAQAIQEAERLKDGALLWRKFFLIIFQFIRV